MRRIIDLTVIFHLRDKNIDCLFVFLSDNPHKTNGSTNVPFDRFSVIYENKDAKYPKNVPASHENDPLDQKNPFIWIQHNETNNFSCGREIFFMTPDK